MKGARKPAIFSTLRDIEAALKKRLADTYTGGSGLLGRAKRTSLTRKGLSTTSSSKLVGHTIGHARASDKYVNISHAWC